MNKRLLLFSLIGFAWTTTQTHAQMDHGPTINVTVKSDGIVRITRQFMVGPFCGFDGPSITSFQKPKYGTLSMERTRERIPKNVTLSGDGHAYCEKETGVTNLFYKAGKQIGTETFDIVIQYGKASRTQKVTVQVVSSRGSR